jgi:hypothetical protein
VFEKLRRKSHSHMARRELGQSLEHFLSAASHAAKGTGATVGPRMSAARERVQPAAGRVKDAASSGLGSTIAALAPLAAATRKSSKEAGKTTRKAKQRNAKALEKKVNKAMNARQSGRRPARMAGLLLAGAAVGAASAFIMRRRRQKWDEYESGRSTAATPMADTTTDTAASVKDPEKDQTSSKMHSPNVARMAGGSSPE